MRSTTDGRPDGRPPRSTPLASFIALTFAFSWLAWGAGFLLAPSDQGTTLLLLVGGFGPAFGAVVRLRREGRSVRAWLRRRVRFRVGLRWYLIALAVPLAFAAVHTVALAARGVELVPSVVPGRVPTFALALVATALVGGGQEEFGWRGYLLPRLQGRYGPAAASLLLGVVWALWHLPLYVIPGAYEWGSPFALYLPVVVGLAVVFTWLCNRVGGTLPALILLHAGVNNSALLVPVSRSTLAGLGGPSEYVVQFVGVALIVLAVLAVDGFALGADARTGDGGASREAGLAVVPDADESESTRA